MRLVLDTNVLVAALITHGTCHEVLESCVYEHEVVASTFLLDELRRTLTGKLGYTSSEANEVAVLLRSRMLLVDPQPLESPACPDPDDDKILGTALAGGCRCLITGDRELLALRRYQGIDIIPPADFWRYTVDQVR